MGPVGDLLENTNLSLSTVRWVGMGGQMKKLLPYLQAFRRKKTCVNGATQRYVMRLFRI